jgi:galactofuranosylgalactofuranosylrhamnosyl-N-acetylglucosaminyl-diphospho-decaprenol beta-1,5/1,6-galactofuranosyltransferase
MPSMKFANILLENNPRAIAYPGMYCKADQPVVFDDETADWVMLRAGVFDFTTYFNSLSVAKLRKYTIAEDFTLHVELKGAACEVQQTMGDAFAAHSILVDGSVQQVAASEEWQSVDLPLRVDENMVIVGFSITTQGRVEIRNGFYGVDYSGELRDVELALSTTTFKKESYIINNVNLVRQHILESEDDIASHFHMYVIDNGRTLDAEGMSGDGVQVIPNDNVGGAGGFTRGMLTAMEQTPVATNVLLMDDDVAVSPESIKRTYNLLRLLKEEYRDAMISGAMLNFEIGEDQWEDIGFMTPEGTFAPCKPSIRLTKFEDLIYNETFTTTSTMRKSMYAAWWYCCIPIDVIKRNGLPLPFFVRCDDAEYGIRCKTPFITMNGLCIWHLSFHERYNAAVERYQTTRNTMVAQGVCDMAPSSDFMHELKNNIRLELKKFGYENAELCLDAFEDFLKGPEFISTPGIAEKTFMAANRNKEQLVDFETLQRQADEDPDLKGFNVHDIDRQLIDGNKPRTIAQRLDDFVTDNGQRYLTSEGKGYAVIPMQGWLYPAGVIRGKKKLVIMDWYNRKGAIRAKDAKRYQQIEKRYKRDLKYYKANIDRLKQEYAEARQTLTSVDYWKHYLKMA